MLNIAHKIRPIWLFKPENKLIVDVNVVSESIIAKSKDYCVICNVSNHTVSYTPRFPVSD
jgi:hypothetical protein